jgi:hypothetical protein
MNGVALEMMTRLTGYWDGHMIVRSDALLLQQTFLDHYITTVLPVAFKYATFEW